MPKQIKDLTLNYDGKKIVINGYYSMKNNFEIYRKHKDKIKKIVKFLDEEFERINGKK